MKLAADIRTSEARPPEAATEAAQALARFREGDISEPYRSAATLHDRADGTMACWTDGSALWIPVDGEAVIIRNSRGDSNGE